MEIAAQIGMPFAVLDHVPVGLCVIDRDYRVLFWNYCLEDWTGIPRAHILGADLGESFPQLKEPQYYDRIVGLFEGGAPIIFSSQLHKNLLGLFQRDGQPRIQRVTVTAVPAWNTSGTAALFAVEDVTDLSNRINAYYQAQRELRTAYHEMESRVERRTADLALAIDQFKLEVAERKQAEAALEQACLDLARANRHLKEMQSQMVQNEKLASIGQLAAGVAHEMNTPVGFVGCNFETLCGYMRKFLDLFAMYEDLHTQVEGGDKAHRLKTMEQIKQKRADMKIDFIMNDIEELFDESSEGIKRVAEIVQNLRDFSRIDQSEAFSDYDLNKGINATLIVARNAIKYEAEVITELGDIPLIRCNGGQINQVLLNILVNAAQAIADQPSDSRGTISIQTQVEGQAVVCTIADNGPGIPAAVCDKIFDPFFTTKPVGKGTGLGLSISHDIIVNKHKGQLTVDSTVGAGTTFTIKLPLEPTAASASDTTVRAC